MKRRFFWTTALVLAALLISGCAAKAREADTPAQAQSSPAFSPGERRSGQARQGLSDGALPGARGDAGARGFRAGEGQTDENAPGENQPGDAAQNAAAQRERARTVTGKVSAIVGNYVTLTLDEQSRTSRQQPAQNATAGDEDTADADIGQGDAAVQTNAKEGDADNEATQSFYLPVGMKIGRSDFSSVTLGSTLSIQLAADPDGDGEIITAVAVG
jgi:hypothetical protein